jgi:hypothetical protein
MIVTSGNLASMKQCHTVWAIARAVLVLPFVLATAFAELLDESGYLGIPETERYPEGRHKPVKEVQGKYYAILPVEVASKQHFEQSKALFVASKDGFVYYSVETRGDFEQLPGGGRAWVTILQRYKYKP